MPRSRPLLSAFALALAAVLALTSCGLVRDARETSDADAGAADSETGADSDQEDAEQDEAEQEDAEDGGAEEAQPYVEALATNSSEGLEDGFDYAQAGSPAHDYLRYQADIALVYEEAGDFEDPWDVELVGDELEMCHPEDCATYGNFEYQDGLLADFEIEGRAVSDNLYPGFSEVTEDGATVTMGASYTSASADVLVVTFGVEADDDTAFELDNADYVAPDGSRTLGAADTWMGKAEYEPGESGLLLYHFAESEPGGHVSFTLECTEGCSGTIEGELPLA
ncbi:hypothetical protein [Nocardiopsis nanhaiensis]